MGWRQHVPDGVVRRPEREVTSTRKGIRIIRHMVPDSITLMFEAWRTEKIRAMAALAGDTEPSQIDEDARRVRPSSPWYDHLYRESIRTFCEGINAEERRQNGWIADTVGGHGADWTFGTGAKPEDPTP